MNILIKASFFLVVFGLFFVVSVSAQYKSMLTGRVSDEKGKSVSGALLTFDKAPGVADGNCSGQSDSVMSKADGSFTITVECDKPNQTIFLFVVPPVKGNAMDMLIPPFDDSLRNKARFAGIPVLIDRNSRIELGDIPLQVSYSTIELYILDKDGKPHFNTLEEWSKLILLLSIRKTSYFVTSLGLSTSDLEERVSLDKGFIRINLPEGEWTLDLFTDWKDFDYKSGQIYRRLSSTQIIIKKNDTLVSLRAVVK
jgi:hypothetical protein